MVRPDRHRRPGARPGHQAAINSAHPETLTTFYTPSNAGDFHDITSGTSKGGPNYSAGPGYDLVTGLGTPKANLVVEALDGTSPAPLATTTSVASAANPAVYGQAVTFTATVSATNPGSGTLTGSVTFLDGATVLGTGTLNGSGAATYTTTAFQLPVGSAQPITASYAGNGSFASSSGNLGGGQMVNPAAAAQVVITTAPQSLTAGVVAGTITVVLEDPYGNAVNAGTGGLTLNLNTTSSGGTFWNTADTATISSVTIAAGSSATSFRYDDTVAGAPTITAAASGLTSATQQETVKPAAASQWVIVAQPSATATAGQMFATQPVVYEEDQFGNLETSDNSTQVTAALNSGSGPLLGTTTVTVVGGVATFTNLADNSAETSALDFNSSNHLPAVISNTVTINPVATTTTVTSSSVNPAVYGQAVTFTVQVTSGSGTPTGTVSFYDGLTLIGTGTLNGGAATYTTSATQLPVGSGQSITASFAVQALTPAAAARSAADSRSTPTAPAPRSARR